MFLDRMCFKLMCQLYDHTEWLSWKFLVFAAKFILFLLIETLIDCWWAYYTLEKSIWLVMLGIFFRNVYVHLSAVVWISCLFINFRLEIELCCSKANMFDSSWTWLGFKFENICWLTLSYMRMSRKIFERVFQWTLIKFDGKNLHNMEK